MELKREVLASDILDPRNDFRPTPTEVEVRWDALLGYSSRLVRGGGRQLPASDFDLEAFGRQTAETCFFCPSRVEAVTPRFPPEIVPDGRIRRGQALLFPNIQAYSKYSSVSIYGPELHYLPLDRMSGRIVGDSLSAQVEFAARATRHDPTAPWVSINANHMLPSGSSLFHPHMQASVDPHPTTMQEQLARVPAERVRDYLDTERRLGERYLGSLGGVEWLAGFAPLGYNELCAFVPGVRSPEQLDEERVEALAEGIARALNLYAEMGYQSYNLAIQGVTSEDGVLSARLVCRSNLQPLYRSDVTYFERLHWQAMIDTTPEDLAARAGDRFRG
jgi:UDPglucose--hexose-1-phosphate uridylyltransferase